MTLLNTHVPSSLYEAIDPADARRIQDTSLSFITLPLHGSWLNMAEIELSVLSRQCLERRIPDKEFLQREVAAWSERRSARVS